MPDRVSLALNGMTDEIFDLIVIGAGINGAGIARDAAMRGLKVLLLDKGDIAGGTSAWSTRLIHGGLRYLEHFELGLVRESLREREVLLRIAPHLVRPIEMLIPIYKGARRGFWAIRAGMIAYDVLSFDKSLPLHRMLWSAEAWQRVPGLNREDLVGAALYYDAQAEFPERLVVENVLSAEMNGCVVKTYTQVNQFIVENQAVAGVEVNDLRSNENYSVRGRMVVNSAGPWVDAVAGHLRLKSMIGGTKGSHIIVGHFSGAPETAIYVEARADHRPFFIIPWNGKYLIGTTEKRFDENPDTVKIDDVEIEYLLSETNRVIPRANLKRDSILFAYSGVRPLPITNSNDEQGITRRHFIHDHAPEFQNLFSIVGGKLTTYRSLSEQVVDLIFRTQKIDIPPPCRTSKDLLPGAESDLKAVQSALETNRKLSATTIDHLVRVYGARASDVLQVAEDDQDLLEVFDVETGAIAAEVVFAFRHELAQTLIDCLLRRTMVGFNSRAGIGADRVAAQIASRHLDWSEQRATDEVTAYRDYRRR